MLLVLSFNTSMPSLGNLQWGCKVWDNVNSTWYPPAPTPFVHPSFCWSVSCVFNGKVKSSRLETMSISDTEEKQKIRTELYRTPSQLILPRGYSQGFQVLKINAAWTLTPLYVSQLPSWPWTWSRSDFKSLYSNVNYVWAMTGEWDGILLLVSPS